MKYRVLIEVVIKAPDEGTAESWAWDCMKGNPPAEIEFDDWVAVTASVEKVKEE